VIRRLQAAYEEARALTTSIDEPQAGFAAATQLTAALQVMLDEVAEFRAVIVARIYEAETVEERSLMKLGKRFGISKSRADQLVQRGKAAERRDRGEQE
jgi:DNA-directed RNA polymerase sigma subunit (sigma70/sigma32)